VKTLLLNSTYQPISFVTPEKAIKLFVKDKVEVCAEWDEIIRWGCGSMKLPAVIRLKYYVRWIPRRMRYNSIGVFRRDRFTCQFCSKSFKTSKLTIDHVIPRARGGKSTWVNCVTSCFNCNNRKGNRTPEEARMRLLKTPKVPNVNLANEVIGIHPQHPQWDYFLGIN